MEEIMKRETTKRLTAMGMSVAMAAGLFTGLLPQDKSGNATVGTDIRLYDSKNCIVHASEEKRVVVQGLDGYIIAEKDNTLLICKLEEEQRIKEFSK